MTLVIVPQSCNTGQQVTLPVPGRADGMTGIVQELVLPPPGALPGISTGTPAGATDSFSWGATNTIAAAMAQPPYADVTISRVACFLDNTPVGSSLAVMVYEYQYGLANFAWLGGTQQIPSTGLVGGLNVLDLLAPIPLLKFGHYMLGVWRSYNGIACRVRASGVITPTSKNVAWFRTGVSYAQIATNQPEVSVTLNTVSPWVMGAQ